MNTEIRNIDSTNNLTGVASKCTLGPVIRFADLEKRVERQYDTDAKALRANYARQNKLLAAVQEYRDLENDAKAREDRMRRVIELLGEEKFSDTRREMLKGKDVSKEIVVSTGDDSPLWEAMRTIVEQMSEAQVIDLQDALLHFGKKASRQAIESALASHKETFETKVRNREKFVSLKR
jgi:hypothetical protein